MSGNNKQKILVVCVALVVFAVLFGGIIYDWAEENVDLGTLEGVAGDDTGDKNDPIEATDFAADLAKGEYEDGWRGWITGTVSSNTKAGSVGSLVLDGTTNLEYSVSLKSADGKKLQDVGTGEKISAKIVVNLADDGSVGAVLVIDFILLTEGYK